MRPRSVESAGLGTLRPDLLWETVKPGLFIEPHGWSFSVTRSSQTAHVVEAS